MKPYDLDAEVKFEYGNESFHTAQLFIQDFQLTSNELVLKLGSEKTDCKAKSTCGIEESDSLQPVGDTNCCAPESQCC